MIAVIEDNDGDYMIYQKTSLDGINHVRFKNLNVFLDSTQKFKAVILDLNLPDCIGNECVRLVRNKFIGKIFVLTGMAGEYLTGAHHYKLIESGATDVFTKDDLLNKNYIQMIRETILKCLSNQSE